MKNLNIFSVKLSAALLLLAVMGLTACNKDSDRHPEPEPGLVDKSNVEIYYSLMSLGSAIDNFDYTLSYVDSDGQLKVLQNPTLPWEVMFNTKVPFKAQMIVDAKLKSDFVNDKTYYKLGYNYSMQYTREHNGSYELRFDNNSLVVSPENIEEGMKQFFPLTFELDVPMEQE